jgi:hypothetical protein
MRNQSLVRRYPLRGCNNRVFLKSFAVTVLPKIPRTCDRVDLSSHGNGDNQMTRHLPSLAVLALGLATFTTATSAMPLSGALAIRNAAPSNVEAVRWGGGGWRGGGWGWGVGAGFLGAAIVGSALAAPYYGYGPYYPAPYYGYGYYGGTFPRYGGPTYDYYRRDFQLRGRNGA